MLEAGTVWCIETTRRKDVDVPIVPEADLAFHKRPLDQEGYERNTFPPTKEEVDLLMV